MPILVGICLLGIRPALADASRTDGSPVERFIAGLDADPTIPADARDLIRSTWKKCEDCDAAEFLTQGLALFSPEFREGLDAYDADDYERCASIMHARRASPSLFVATNAAAYEIKALMAMERLVEAADAIHELQGDVDLDADAYTYLAPELSFLSGFCLLADLQYKEAGAALSAFLGKYPDAPMRLTISARQILAELANREPGQIGEVVDLMNYARHRLVSGDSGHTVQERQQRVVDLLDTLIEEMEQQEKKNSSSSSSSGGGSGSSKGSQGGRAPSKPMADSQLPGGSGSDEVDLRSHRRANPAEAWGAMPPAQRERILQALRDSFPSRYRMLVEQYYEELAKQR